MLFAHIGVFKTEEGMGTVRKKEGKPNYTTVKMRNSLCMYNLTSSEAPPDPQGCPGDHRGVAGFDTSYFA